MTDLHRLRALFDALLDVPAEQWEGWFEREALDTATRSELRRLAAADESAQGVLDISLGVVAGSIAGLRDAEAPDPTGRRVGPFRIVRRLGEGGMASVYLAQRDGADFDQAVALKLLRHGALSEIEQRFFRRERQVLARLSHPNIARLIDGGVDEGGVPYLAMEYVEGTSITRWCREHASDALQRVTLVAKVARAVAAAHAALVVHRDIKPSNVLVDADGEPRLLDFGIAKLLESEGEERTRSVLAPMTPEYAAPEQLDGGAIGTATDVYALGVLLYELLTGVRPKRGALRPPSVRHGAGQPTPITRRARDDLDNVVMMALAEDPAQRYPGAAAFADDLDRYLAHQPVIAHPPSAWYRTRKFVQRHRGGVMVGTLLLLGLLASLAFALWQAREARAQAHRAERVSQFLIELFEAAKQELPREQRPTTEALVREAAERLERDTELAPDTRAALSLTLSGVARLAGEYPRSLQLADAALAQLALAGNTDARLRLRAEIARAQTLRLLGRQPEARAALEPQRAAILAQADQTAVEGIMTLSALELETGEVEASIATAHATEALARRVFPADGIDLLTVELSVGDLLGEAGRIPEAIERRERTLARWRERGHPQDADYVSALMNLAVAHVTVGDLERGEAGTADALARLREIHAAPHDKIAGALQNLGGIKSMRGREEDALPLLEESLRMYEQLFGRDHMQVASVLDAIGSVHLGRRDYVAAIAMYRRATGICDAGHFDDDPACARAWQNLSFAHLQRGEFGPAERANARSRALRRALFGESHPQYANALSGLAGIQLMQRRYQEALQSSERALAIVVDAGQGEGPAASRMQSIIARALRELGRSDDALPALERAEALTRRNAPDDRERALRLQLLRVDVLSDLGRRDEARRIARAALGAGLDPGALREEEWARLRAAAAD